MDPQIALQGAETHCQLLLERPVQLCKFGPGTASTLLRIQS